MKNQDINRLVGLFLFFGKILHNHLYLYMEFLVKYFVPNLLLLFGIVMLLWSFKRWLERRK